MLRRVLRSAVPSLAFTVWALSCACSSSDALSGGSAGAGNVTSTGGAAGASAASGSPTSGGASSAGTGATNGGSGGAAGGSGGSAGASAAAGSSNSAGSAGSSPQACDASAAPAVAGLGLKTIVSSSELKTLSQAVQAPGSDAWYLIEQGGKIRVFVDGALKPTPFYDVSSEMQLDAMYDERGLHSIAFPPDYATSGLFYVVLTPTTGTRANRDLVLEHKRSAADPYRADPAVVREFLNLEGVTPNSLFANIHNAYHAQFGPDGKLYVGMGDGGGSCNDNQGFVGFPQDISKPYGKILRFDPSSAAPYGAADNPFVQDGDPRVFHYGLRNPFRFSWDLTTGDLYIGEVGHDTHEDINVAPAGSKGLNFGWAAWEGDQATCTGKTLRAGSTVTPPIFFTTHGGGSGIKVECKTSPFCDYGAIVGGPVYRGSLFPALQGVYFFGDWSADNLGALRHCADKTSPVTVIDIVADPNQPTHGFLVPGAGVPDVQAVTSIVEDHQHEMYLVLNGNTLAAIVPPQ